MHYTKTAAIARLLFITVLSAISVIGCTEPPQVDVLWQQQSEFTTAQEIVDTYKDIKSKAGNDSRLQIKNLCHMIWHSGEYIIKCKGKNDDINILPEHISELPLGNDSVKAFLQKVKAERFADHYFMLRAMQRGEDFDAARDGLTITVFFPIRAINNNDYDKLRQVFSSDNEILHEVYLEKMKFPFQNSGCNSEFESIRPLIEKNVADTPVKKEILELYDYYTPVMPGKKAPDYTLKDNKGNLHSLTEFKGKTLVIDVWATWCSSCLKKMPEFMKLRDEFRNNPNVEFITVSIDRSKDIKKWKTAIDKHKMNGMLNLIPDTESASPFECDYRIVGVPRYIIIDQDGNIVTAYAPPAGPYMKDIIMQTLNNR